MLEENTAKIATIEKLRRLWNLGFQDWQKLVQIWWKKSHRRIRKKWKNWNALGSRRQRSKGIVRIEGRTSQEDNPKWQRAGPKRITPKL